MNSSYRLWSIWEMINLPIGLLLKSYSFVASFGQTASLMIGNNKGGISLQERDYMELFESVSNLADTCETVGLHVTAVAAQTVKKEFEKSVVVKDGKYLIEMMPLVRIQGEIHGLQNCLKNESSLKVALILPPNKENLLSPKGPLFGDDVKNKFQGASFDIDEAAKCLALGRYTASVFHLMRVMEITLHAVHKCLGLPPALTGNDRTWGSILQKIRNEYKMRPDFAEMQTFQHLHARLDAVKDAWRNGTMHVENKYTEEEAENIYAMVRGFVINVASRMDENGLPLA